MFLFLFLKFAETVISFNILNPKTMRKLFLLASALFAAAGALFAQDEQPITYTDPNTNVVYQLEDEFICIADEWKEYQWQNDTVGKSANEKEAMLKQRLTWVKKGWILKNGMKFSGKLEVPAQIEGYPVLAIGEFAFFDEEAFQQANEQGKNGFSQKNYKLTGITLPSTVEEIRMDAFLGCVALTGSLDLTHVRYIRYGSFLNCSGLSEVHLGSGIIHSENGYYTDKNGDLQQGYHDVSGLQDAQIFEYIDNAGGFSNNILPLNLFVPVGYRDRLVELQGKVIKYPKDIEGEYEVYYEPLYFFAANGKLLEEGETPKYTPVTVKDNVVITLTQTINSTTDLTDNVVDNVYFNINETSGDTYDETEGCIVLESTMSNNEVDSIKGMIPGSDKLKEHLNGISLEVPAGSGTLSLEFLTKGNRKLCVKFGEETAYAFTQAVKSTLNVPYNFDRNTVVYIYATTEASPKSSAELRAGGDNSVSIYNIKLKSTPTAFTDAVAAPSVVRQGTYTLSGKRVSDDARLVNTPFIKNGKVVINK